MNTPAGDADARVQRAASLLLSLRQPGPRPVGLPADLAPRDEAEAYRLQRAIAVRQHDLGGYWKAAMSGPHTGTCAPVFAAEVHASGARVTSVIAARPGIEPEIAFTLGRALPPLAAGRRYERDRVAAAIAYAHPAIEIVVSRFQRHETATPLDRLADNISNGGLVLGPPCERWQSLDFATIALTLTISPAPGAADAQPQHTAHRSRGGHPQGDPLLPMIWLANHRAALGAGMRAGDVVTTGSYAGLHYIARGTAVGVEFEGLGAVEFNG